MVSWRGVCTMAWQHLQLVSRLSRLSQQGAGAGGGPAKVGAVAGWPICAAVQSTCWWCCNQAASSIIIIMPAAPAACLLQRAA